jgi:predicted lipid-binding transport protein (Tim44 family)
VQVEKTSREFFGGLMAGAVVGVIIGDSLLSLHAGVAVGVFRGVYFHVESPEIFERLSEQR